MELIVAPPLYFDVKHRRNTRMRPDHPFGKPDKKLAFEQWAKMVSILHHDMGVKVNFVDPVPELDDMAFACDPGLWINDLFIASNFETAPGIESRRPEVGYFKKWFVDKGATVFSMFQREIFEGGDCLVVGDKLLLGWGDNRTNREGVLAIEDILKPEDIKVIPIRRATEEFYHLNSVMAHYPSANLIAYYPPAFEKNTEQVLRSDFPGTKIYPLSDDEAMRRHPAFGGEYIYSYTLNSIEHNGRVIMPYCAPTLKTLLTGLGLEMIVPGNGSSSEFERSGGSYRCLTMIHNATEQTK